MAVNCGHVYYLFLPIAGKDKLLVPAYIHQTGKVRFFVINSERTEFQIIRPQIANHVIALPQNLNQRFLTYDSWLVCNEVIGGWTVDEIDNQHDCYRGPLDSNSLAVVRALIQGSRLYSINQKTLFLAQWP